MQELFTPQEVADILKIARSTVHRKAADGEWPSLRVSARVIRFTQEHLDEIVAGMYSPPAPPRRRSNLQRKRMKEALRKITAGEV